MKDVSFVRTGLIEEQEPPLTERGAVKWMRENLFSSPVNAVLTVVSIGVVYLIAAALFPWLVNSVWSADSLEGCREALHGQVGACFSVITDRWHQLIYGFYPQELYWRANLTLLLLFAALLPVLYDGVWRPAVAATIAVAVFLLSGWMIWYTHAGDMGSVGAVVAAIFFAGLSLALFRYDLSRRWMLYFTPIFPFLMVWLVWGGSIWGPISALLGFVIGYFAYRLLVGVSGTLVATILAILAPVVWWLFIASPAANGLAAVVPIDIQAVESRKLGGFMISIIIGLAGIVLSLPIGVLLALGRQSDLLIVKAICVGFIEFVRGVPLITLLFTAVVLLNYFLPTGTNFDIVLRVIIMVTLFSAAYMAETIRGGLAALPRGQYEAADSLGLDYWKAQRLIIMPQALKISIPGIVNNFIGLFKDTTLVVFVGIFDVLGFVNAIRSDTAWHGIYWELFIFVGGVFFVSCFSMSRYSMYLERKLQTDHR